MARERVSEIVAEMVANVMSVAVEPGDKVAAGDVVVLLESMKMEIPVIAEDDGTVRAVKIAPADVVQEGDVLLELRPHGLTSALAEGAGFEPAADISASDRFQGGSDRPLRHPSVPAGVPTAPGQPRRGGRPDYSEPPSSSSTSS